jgi:hypothetical protein
VYRNLPSGGGRELTNLTRHTIRDAIKYYSPQSSTGYINQKEFIMETITLANNIAITKQTVVIAHKKDPIITYMLKSVESGEVEPSAYIEVTTHISADSATTQTEAIFHIETDKHDSSFKVKQELELRLQKSAEEPLSDEAT